MLPRSDSYVPPFPSGLPCALLTGLFLAWSSYQDAWSKPPFVIVEPERRLTLGLSFLPQPISLRTPTSPSSTRSRSFHTLRTDQTFADLAQDGKLKPLYLNVIKFSGKQTLKGQLFREREAGRRAAHERARIERLDRMRLKLLEEGRNFYVSDEGEILSGPKDKAKVPQAAAAFPPLPEPTSPQRNLKSNDRPPHPNTFKGNRQHEIISSQVLPVKASVVTTIDAQTTSTLPPSPTKSQRARTPLSAPRSYLIDTKAVERPVISSTPALSPPPLTFPRPSLARPLFSGVTVHPKGPLSTDEEDRLAHLPVRYHCISRSVDTEDLVYPSKEEKFSLVTPLYPPDILHPASPLSTHEDERLASLRSLTLSVPRSSVDSDDMVYPSAEKTPSFVGPLRRSPFSPPALKKPS